MAPAVTYVAPIIDVSGYAEAARNYVAALLHAGVEVCIEPISFERNPPAAGRLGSLLADHIRRDLPTSVNLLHMTPENYRRFASPGKYNIAVTAWETNRLPEKWVPLLNEMDEVWVPSRWNQECFKGSGVTRSVYVFPHTINQDYVIGATTDRKLGIDDDIYVFYSIFQWLPRKNPIGLLIAYLTEFGPRDKVSLAMKTYRQVQGASSLEEDRVWLRQQIINIKNDLHLNYYPSIKLIVDPLSREEVLTLHARGDCFVLASRAEGFSLGHFEAMCLGKPTIGTRYGGSLEFMNDQNSLLVDCTETPVYGMPWPIYTGHQNWSEPSIMDIRRKLRWVFEHREEARVLGTRALESIRQNFSWQQVGGLMRERLERIGK